MKDLLRDERGGAALLYVIMISIVLMIVTPVILMTGSSNAFNDTRDKNDRIATNLTVSGIESFILYLNAYSSGDRETYLQNYTGFVPQLTITLPEGDTAYYSLEHAKDLPSTGKYTVTSTAKVGNKQKSLKYSIDVSTPSLIIDPNNKTAAKSDKVFVGANNNNTVPSNLNPPVYEPTLKQTLQDYQAATIKSINDSITAFVNSPDKIICPAACSTDDIKAIMANNTGIDPLIIYASSLSIKDTDHVSLNRNGKALVLIVDQLSLGDNKGNWNDMPSLELYGDLIIRQSFSHKIGASEYIRSVSRTYGDLWMPFDVTLAAGNFNAEHSIYAKSLTTVLANVTAPLVVVDNALHITGAIVSQTANGLTATQVVAGSLNVESSRLTTAGDILVTGSASISNSYGDPWGLTKYKAGGYLAVGDNLTINLGSTPITTGGGSTVVVVPGNSGGPGTGGGAWNPLRQ